MRQKRRGAAGVRVAANGGDLDVAGWCDSGCDATAITERMLTELRHTQIEPGDQDGGFDYLSIWCSGTGEVDGSMLLRGVHAGHPLHSLVDAASTWLSEGGLARSRSTGSRSDE